MIEIVSGDLAGEQPADDDAVDMRQVLPGETLRELTVGASAVLELARARGADVDRQGAWVAAWIAPLLAFHRVEFAAVQQAAELADLRLQVEQAGAALAELTSTAQRLREERDEAARRLRRNEVRVVLDVDTPTIVQWTVDVAREKATEELSNWCSHVWDSFTSVDELLEQMEARLDQLRGGADPGDPPDWADETCRAQKADMRDAGLRQRAYERDGRCCRYCGVSLLEKGVYLSSERHRVLVFDHVDPNLPAGPGAENFVTACAACQKKKGGRTPAEADMVLLPEYAPIPEGVQADGDPDHREPDDRRLDDVSECSVHGPHPHAQLKCLDCPQCVEGVS